MSTVKKMPTTLIEEFLRHCFEFGSTHEVRVDDLASAFTSAIPGYRVSPVRLKTTVYDVLEASPIGLNKIRRPMKSGASETYLVGLRLKPKIEAHQNAAALAVQHADSQLSTPTKIRVQIRGFVADCCELRQDGWTSTEQFHEAFCDAIGTNPPPLRAFTTICGKLFSEEYPTLRKARRRSTTGWAGLALV